MATILLQTTTNIHAMQNQGQPNLSIKNTVKDITEEILDEGISMEPTSSLPAPANLAKAAYHHRQCHCPKDSKTQNSELAEYHITEGFFHKDVAMVTDTISFSPDKMIELLSHSKNLFTDATFKVIKQPFTQLPSTIHLGRDHHH